MTDFIDKYFKANSSNQFFPPGTTEQIINLENKLGIKLPNDYKDFLRLTNGFDGIINEFVARFDPIERIYQSTQDNCSKFFPWAVFIGTNGNIEMFVIDKRSTPFQFGLLPYIASDNDFIPLGDTFGEFIHQLYTDTAFGKTQTTQSGV
jgi:cell wall assembly regulator SMI1